MGPIPAMDPELEQFMRIKPKPLTPRGGGAMLELADRPTALAASPSGRLLAAGCVEDEIVIFEDNLRQIGKLEGHAGGTASLAFAAGGALLVSAGEDGTAAVWRVEGLALAARLECEGVDADRTPDGHTVGCVAVSPDGLMAACAAGKTIHLFEPAAEDVVATRRVFPPVPGGIVSDLRFPAPGKLLTAFYGGVALFDVAAGRHGMVLEHRTNILSASATPDLRWIVGGCMDSTVHIWHLNTLLPGQPSLLESLALPQQLPQDGAEAGPQALARAAPAAGVVSPSGPGPLGEATEAGPSSRSSGGLPPPQQEQQQQSGGASTAAWGAVEEDDEGEGEDGYDDGLGGGTLPEIAVVEGPDGERIEVLELTCGGYSGKVVRVDFGVAQDGSPALASSGGSNCLVWAFRGMGPAGTAPTITLGHTKPVQCQAWHPERRGVLATGGRDGRLIVYETYNAADAMELGMPALCGPAALDPEPWEEVVAVAWSSGGALVSAHADGSIKSWEWEEAVA